jgi:BirA family transcriptional regulator, biotin operon repressor / biotin---[acetyl-CoA-carboxylase] ligase
VASVARGEPLAEGHWLIALAQSAGRGRQGRQWQSPTGNFHGSTLVRVSPGDPPPQTLALVAAIAVHDAVRLASGGTVVPQLKWPNDLLVAGAKLAGILLERSGDAVIAGIGVNLATAAILPDRRTIALGDLGSPVAVDAFAAMLAECFAAALHRWRTSPLSLTVADWCARAHPRGTALALTEGPDAGLTGAFDGLEEDGSLRLALADGRVLRIVAGEVSLVA